MRLLFASSIKTWGGGEEWMLSSALGLRSRGHSVVLAAPARSTLAARARGAGLPIVPAPFAADADVVSFARIFLACRTRRVEAVVLNMDRVLRVGGTAARFAGVRVVLPRRGSEFPLKDRFLYRWTYRKVATGVIVNSEATARTLTRDIPWRPAGRIRVLPNGVELDRFAAVRPRDEVRAEWGIPPSAAVLLGVGELTSRKNFALLLEAVARLRPAGLDPWVVLAGEGIERDALARRAAELGLSARFRLLGFRDDVPDLLAAADVLVHPARVEGFGYAVAEAMAAGCPVVATDASSLPEVLGGGTGILFPPDDVPRLAEALETYLKDPGRRAVDGARGRARARAEFSSARRLLELETILREEIESARRAGRS